VVRAIRNRIKRHDLFVNVVTAVLAIYLAAGNILSGVGVPSEAFWSPWKAPFIGLLVAAIYVPIYGLYRALDAHYEAQDREEAEAEKKAAERQQDLNIYCQQAAAAILGRCPQTAINELAVQVWLCRKDGGFDHRARFYLPHYNKVSGVEWRKGKGVAGTAWIRMTPVAADLAALRTKWEAMGEKAFGELPADERFGMTYKEVQASSDSRGAVAIPLFSTESSPAGSSRTILGIFLVDYTAEDGGFPCIKSAVNDWSVRSILGACETVLTAGVQAP